MVGVGDGKQSIVARVSVVDFNGVVLLDTFVSPTLPVVDYRTSVSGVRKSDVDNGMGIYLFRLPNRSQRCLTYTIRPALPGCKTVDREVVSGNNCRRPCSWSRYESLDVFLYPLSAIDL